MAGRIVVIDSGAVARQLKRLIVVDSGGVSRAIKRLFVIDGGGVARLVFAPLLHETTLTVGDDGVIVNYGYAQGLYGALGGAVFNDNSAVARTIVLCVWSGASVQFWLDSPGIANSDATFYGINLDGTALLRSAAVYNGAASGGTRSSWTWASGFMHGGGSVVLQVRA